MPFVWNQQEDRVEEKSEAEIAAHEKEIDAAEQSPKPSKGEDPVPHMKTAGLRFRRMTDEEVEAWQAAQERKAKAAPA